MKRLIAAAALTAMTSPALAEDLTIERLYASPSLTGPAPRALTFSPDGTRLTFLRAKEEDANVLDLWAMDVEGGEPYLLVDSSVLVEEEGELSEAERQLRERARISSRGIVRYDWDSAGEAILVPLAGDVFYVDIETQEATRLLETEAFETDFRISPDGNFVSFVRDQNLFYVEIATGEETQVTDQGGGLISYGMAEFVVQEELSRSTGYWWSGDERYIAYTRTDETPVENIPRLEIDANGGAQLVDQRYPRAGENNALIDLFIFDRETGEHVEVDLGDDEEIYLARLSWRSGSAYVQILNRPQTRIDIRKADPQTGDAPVWYTESTDIWINMDEDFIPLSDGRFVWTSEDTPGGYRHISILGADGEREHWVTSGEWLVNGVNAIDEEAGLIYFTGWVDTPLQRHLYSVPLAGGEPTRITSGEGRWSARFNSGRDAFIGSYNDSDTPPQTGLYGVDGERIRWVEENPLDETHPYFPYADSHIVPQFGTLEASDGTTLHYQIHLPPDFDPEREYPAIQYVYGGPGPQLVHQGWQNLRAQIFAQAGYVYFTIDNRGAGNRGRDFEGHLKYRMGIAEVEDQLLGLDHLQSLDYVDADRVGVWGWSYGGYMTLMMALQAPGRYAAGVSGAPVTDWALYDTTYTERYMSTPQENPEGYEQGSVFAHLDGYETPLFLIHGMADDNVIFAHSTRLYSELQQRRESFEMMTYPGQRHGVRGEDRSVHLWTDVLDFFNRHLTPEE
jgi:dipeptidyl-peptidase-4